MECVVFPFWLILGSVCGRTCGVGAAWRYVPTVTAEYALRKASVWLSQCVMMAGLLTVDGLGVGRVCYTRGYFQGRGSPHSPLVELFNKLNSILVTL
jgi:hypothetical protein